MEQEQPNEQSYKDKTYLINIQHVIWLTNIMRVQNEKYQIPILSQSGQMENSINAITIRIPNNKKIASFPNGLGMFHVQNPLSVTILSCGFVGSKCFGYFFLSSFSKRGSLSNALKSPNLMNSNPSNFESSTASSL